MLRALLLVDLQNDFMPGGALAVREGDETVPVANRLMADYAWVIATQDWHPPTHLSFAANHPGKQPYEIIDLDGLDQVLWPTHCVTNTEGAAFHPDLNRDRIDKVVTKGSDPRVDSYSAFFDNGRRASTGLGDFCHQKKITGVDIMGLATDYCVKFTALDAVSLGLETRLIAEGCRGVNLGAQDSEAAIAAMTASGVVLIAP